MERHQLIYRLHELKGALIVGAAAGALIALSIAPFENGFKPILAWGVAGAVAGAVGTALVAMSGSESPVFFCSIFPISGAAGGFVFWLVVAPEMPFLWFVVGGALALPLLVLAAALGELLGSLMFRSDHIR